MHLDAGAQLRRNRGSRVQPVARSGPVPDAPGKLVREPFWLHAVSSKECLDPEREVALT